MADKLILVNLDLNGNLLKNVAVEVLASAPANPVTGQFYVNSTDGKFYYYNGTKWSAGTEYSASNKSDAEGTIPVYDGMTGDTFEFRVLKGSGNLQVAQANGIITISIDEANLSVSTAVANAIATAKSEAIAAAASDATSKANAAQAAAIAAAIGESTDTKDSDTIKGAKKYADDKVATEASNRATAVSGAITTAENYTDAEIQKLDVADSEVDGQVVTAVSESDGKISVTRKALGADKVTLSSQKVVATNVKAAIEEIADALASDDITVTTETPSSGSILKKYKFKKGTADLVTIDIPKDYLVKSASVDTVVQTDLDPDGKFYDVTSTGKTHDHPSYQEGGVWKSENWAVGDKYIDFVINSKDAQSGAESHIYLNVNELVDAYTAGNGINVSNANVISLVLDNTSEGFLSLSANGIKLSGVQTAIDTARDAAKSYADGLIAALDADVDASGTPAHSGTMVVTGVTQQDGKITGVDSTEVEAAGAAAAAEAAAKTYADGLKTTIDGYKVNGKAINGNPTISGALAKTKITAASSGVTITTDAPGTIKAFLNGVEVQVAIAYDGTTATLTWNGNSTLDIYYVANAIAMS